MSNEKINDGAQDVHYWMNRAAAAEQKFVAEQFKCAELLAALKWAEGFVAGYVGEGFGDDFESPTLEVIRKAIAKAEVQS